MDLLKEHLALYGNGFHLYPKSYTRLDDGELALCCVENTDLLVVQGEVRARFAGVEIGECKICEISHENRLILNDLLPYTKPIAFGSGCASFGFGDRLGFANPAQLRMIEGTSIRPVLAQQSRRELQLTGRSLTDVMDTAAWAVFREGYKTGYACDGDHLKTVEEVQEAVALGASMITLDCSLVLRPLDESTGDWENSFQMLSDSAKAEAETKYLSGKSALKLGLKFTKSNVAKLHRLYTPAIELCRTVYEKILLSAERPIDFEISLDETEETTTPEAHFYVASELSSLGIRVTSMAPKFVGEFQKAIEYIGDTDELRQTMAVHAKIADYFGYKLSLHSGSEKFAVLPILAETTQGRYHVKTSGTSWLEVVEVISKHNPALYRRMHAAALDGIQEARKHYVVHCDLSQVPPLDSVPDEKLPDYLLQNDSRQLMHITYGHILSIPALKKDIFQFLWENRSVYETEAEDLYHRHLKALGWNESGKHNDRS